MNRRRTLFLPGLAGLAGCARDNRPASTSTTGPTTSAPQTIAQFEAEFGIHVRYAIYEVQRRDARPSHDRQLRLGRRLPHPLLSSPPMRELGLLAPLATSDSPASNEPRSHFSSPLWDPDLRTASPSCGTPAASSTTRASSPRPAATGRPLGSPLRRAHDHARRPARSLRRRPQETRPPPQRRRRSRPPPRPAPKPSVRSLSSAPTSTPRCATRSSPVTSPAASLGHHRPTGHRCRARTSLSSILRRLRPLRRLRRHPPRIPPPRPRPPVPRLSSSAPPSPPISSPPSTCPPPTPPPCPCCPPRSAHSKPSSPTPEPSSAASGSLRSPPPPNASVTASGRSSNPHETTPPPTPDCRLGSTYPCTKLLTPADPAGPQY